jgi:PilZ domain
MPSKDNTNFYTDETTIAAERRSHLRYPFTASVEAIEPKSGTKIHGRSTDLGLGGCYVDSLNPFAVGTVVKIRITKNDESFDAKAMVTFSQVGMGMGLSFVASEPQQSALFQRWVTELSGGGIEQDLKENRDSRVSESAGPHEASHAEQADVLHELVIALMRKGLLAEREGREMLRKLHRAMPVADKSTAGS